MSHVAVSNLAYAHPGGDLLFSGVSFRLSGGKHAGLIGTNGVGKTTLMRVLAGEFEATEGDVAYGGRALYMAQNVGADGAGTIRELLLSVAPARVRDAGMALLQAEAAGDGMAIGEAIGTWSDLGGYELEGQWDAACRRIVRAGLDEVGDRPSDQVSGGERKRLVLDLLLRSDAQVLLLDEPDNFLDVPAKRELERSIRETRKTVLVISHDRELLSEACDTIVTLEGRRRLGPRRLLRDLPGGAGASPAADGRPPPALPRGGEAPAGAHPDLQGAGEVLPGLGQAGEGDGVTPEALRRRRPAARARHRPAHQDAPARRRLRAAGGRPAHGRPSTAWSSRSTRRSTSGSASASSAPTARGRRT